VGCACLNVRFLIGAEHVFVAGKPLDALPLNSNGKIAKPQLREMAAAGPAPR
jgi:hypothetical protein